MEDDMSSNFGKGLFWGFIAGATAGIVTGVLLAPKSGKDVRNSIANKINQFLDSDISQGNNDLHLVGIENEGKRMSDAVVEDAKEKAESLLADAEKILSEIKLKPSSPTGTAN